MLTFEKVKKDYLDNKTKLNFYQKVMMFCLITVIAGMIGWLIEFVFYFFNGGMKEFYLQGGNFLPWINIYAIGAFLIIFSTRRIKKKPILVFLITAIVTGALEYFSGLAIYKIGNGLRFWDYNTEILNFGNIGGFVCFRSFLCFGLGGLLLIYILMPRFIYFVKKYDKKDILYLCIAICSLFLIDEFYNLIIANMFNLPNAVQIYRSLGLKYVT